MSEKAKCARDRGFTNILRCRKLRGRKPPLDEHIREFRGEKKTELGHGLEGWIVHA